MSALESALTVAAWVTLLAVTAAVASNPRLRSWADETRGHTWTRRVGVLAVVVGAVSMGAFAVRPPVGVFVLGTAGGVAFGAGVLATAGAANTAIAATDEGAGRGRVVRAFWYSAATYHRGTRLWFGLSLLAFVLTSLVAGLSVATPVRAFGALALGGVLACVVLFAAVGVFVPARRNEHVVEAVARTRE